MTEWFFHSAANKAISSANLRPVGAVSAPAPDQLVLDRIKMQISELPKRDTAKFDFLMLEKRRNYPRAYEYWSKIEEELLLEAANQSVTIPELSKLFGRQPSVLEDKLNILRPGG